MVRFVRGSDGKLAAVAETADERARRRATADAHENARAYGVTRDPVRVAEFVRLAVDRGCSGAWEARDDLAWLERLVGSHDDIDEAKAASLVVARFFERQREALGLVPPTWGQRLGIVRPEP